jgi:GT2 family glycosyltransferase
MIGKGHYAVTLGERPNHSKDGLAGNGICVYVVILSYCREDDLRECLSSVHRQTFAPIKTVVVDSCPTHLETIPEGVDVYIKAKANNGWGAGNNIGIRAAIECGADYILLLNDDAIAETGCIEELVWAMEQNQGLGIAGPIIYFYDSPGKIWHDGGELDPRLLVAVPSHSKGLKIRDALVSGCCMMLSSTLLKEIGLLEERWFMGREEDDINIRARKAGFRTGVVTYAKAWHKVRISGNGTPSLAYYNFISTLLFIEKHFGKLEVMRFTILGIPVRLRRSNLRGHIWKGDIGLWRVLRIYSLAFAGYIIHHRLLTTSPPDFDQLVAFRSNVARTLNRLT